MFEYIIALLALLRTLTGIRFFLIKRKVKGPVSIIPEAQPFFKKVPGNKIALFIHGFTASPKEFKDLSEYLAKKGISSYALLLPGHGTSPERLALIKYYQWIEAVQENIDIISKDYKEIYLVGNSFGGNLALICANHSEKIKGIITLGTPIVFRRHKINRYFLLPILKRIKLFQKKSKRSLEFIKNRGCSYNTVPLRSANEMLKAVELSKKELKKIKKPILVMHVKNDPVVSEESHKYILEKISSQKKVDFEVPESYHVFILDKYAPLVNEKIGNFILKKSK